MKPALTVICGLLFFALPSIAQSKSDQDKNSDKAQIVGTAEITKIDAKKKTLQVRNVAESTNTSPTEPGTARRSGGGYPGGGGGYPGGGYPGGRRRPGGYPGGGYPGGGYPGGGYPGGGGGRYPGGGSAGTSQVKEYKVFITKDTILKLEDQDAEFSDLHVGDRIVVSGIPKGTSGDLEATSVTRKF
jgi:hypothetical protein